MATYARELVSVSQLISSSGPKSCLIQTNILCAKTSLAIRLISGKLTRAFLWTYLRAKVGVFE